MLLNDYLEKLKNSRLKEMSNKPWLSSQVANDDFFSNIYPDDKIEEWNAVDMANKGCCGSSKDNPEVRKLLKDRLLVAYDLSTAFHYLHEHRYVDFHCFHQMGFSRGWLCVWKFEVLAHFF